MRDSLIRWNYDLKVGLVQDAIKGIRMSNKVNLQLLDRAAEMIDYWEGTQWAEKIEQLIDRNDLDELYRVVLLAEGEASSQEFSRWEITTW